MAVPTVRGVGTIAAGAAAAITPPIPAGSLAGDYHYLVVETGGDTPTLSTANGFDPTPVGTIVNAGASTRYTVFEREAWNGTDGDPTVAATSNHVIGRIIGVIPPGANPLAVEAISSAPDDVSNTAASVPGGTTTGIDRLVIIGLTTDLPDATGTANFSGWANAALSSVTEIIDNTRAAGNGGGIGVATGTKATAGAVGSTTVTLASAAVKAMMSFAVYEVTGGAAAQLEAALTGSASVAAALSTSITMAADLTGSGTMATVLTTEKPLVALLEGSSTVAAALSTEITMAAVLAGDGATTATLIDSTAGMAAILAGDGTLAAALTTTISLEAAMSSTGTVAAVLTLPINLAAALAGSGFVSGTFVEPLPWPLLDIKIDWDGNGFGDAIDNVTADFKSVSWSRGADKAASGKVGSASIVLNDFDNKYVDTNASSPLYGRLNIGARVWVTATWNGIRYGIVSGYIDRIAPIPHSYEAHITVTDLFGLASRRQVRPPSTLTSVRGVREWVLGQLGLTSAQMELSVNENAALRRVPWSESALAVLEAVNKSVGSTHVVVPGGTESAWQKYVVIDRHRGLKDAADVSVDGTSHIKRSGFGGWETSLETVENRVNVSGEFPAETFDDEPTEVWRRTTPLYVDSGSTVDVWAEFSSDAKEVSVSYLGSGATVSIEQISARTAKITVVASSDAVLNEIVVTGRSGSGGGSAELEIHNTSSQALYGVHDGEAIDSSLVGESIASGAAEYVVTAHGEPRKTPSVLLMEDFDEILQNDVGAIASVSLSRLDVTNRRMRVRGIDGDAQNGIVWEVTWHTVDEQDQHAALGLLDTFVLGTNELGT